MKRFILHIIIFILISFNFTLKGQVSFDAILEQKEVSINQLFSITFQLKLDNRTYEIDDIHYPDFSSFDLVGNSNSTQSNLKSSTISKTFTFRALKKGTFKIEEASITVDGKIYKTKTTQIKITGKSNQPKTSKKQNIPQRGEVLTNETSKNTKLLVTASNLSPYAGEQVLISLHILSKDYNVLHRIRESKANRFKNFTAIDYPVKRTAIQEENYQGSLFYSQLITQKIIVPQQVGKISLEPFQLEFPFLIKTNQRDFFGRPVNQYIWVKLDSNELIFNVKPLPSTGKPSNFSGAVGNFNLNVFSNKNNINAGESVEFDVEISGKGDFKMVTIPKLSLPDELEVYEPNTRESITLTKEGHKGKISKNYVVVPQYKGNYEIPTLEFSYFNPTTGKYETKTSQKTTLNVINGPEKPIQDQTDSITKKQSEINSSPTTNTQDELFLRPLKQTLTSYNPILSPITIWMIIIGSVLFVPLLFGFLALLKKQKKNHKTSKPKESSKKHLANAKKHLARNESLFFYDAIEKTIYYTLSERLNITTSNYNLSTIKTLLQEQSISEEKINQVEEILNACSFQKYAPTNSTHSMETIYQKTIHFINTLKN
ncbi:hypothetical protein UJ101_01142 [Flavobacteriaceae bacterium UJ101]|nr:hypothetical protein UJ101_01142 [Flavobacteriaceae bacterium UJ101]